MAPHDGDELHELEARLDPRLLRALDLVAPGTPLREGIDNIIQARTGGLILVADADEVSFLFSGGIKLDIDYTPALLYQVAKMDGAIVLDAGINKIRWANVQLMPIPTVLSKANQGLATLEKYRVRLDQLSARLTSLEFLGGCTLHDVLSVLQRAELVTRMAAEVERYIIELGTAGRLIEMQLEETVVGVMAERAALVRDYSVVDSEEHLERTITELAALPHQELLDFGRLAEMLGYDRKTSTIDFAVSPRGYRALSRIPRLPRLLMQKIVHRFGDLDAIVNATEDELQSVDEIGNARAREIREGLRTLQEVDIVDR